MKLRTHFHMWVAAVVAATLAMIGLTTASLPALATGTDDSVKVCSDIVSGDGWSNKIDVTGDKKSVEVTAPAGKLIDKYCVKSASTQNGNGPEIKNVDPPAKTVTITHSSGKDVSHYMVHYVPQGKPTVEYYCDGTITATWPYAFDGQHINFKIQQLDDDGKPFGPEESISWHWDVNTPGYGQKTYTVNFRDTAKWATLNWEYFRITFIQVNELDIWPNVDCGEPTPDPMYVCQWDAENDVADIVEVAEGGLPRDQVDESDCTPSMIEICVADGNGGFEKVSVYDDEVGYTAVDPKKCETPPPPVCENFSENQIAAIQEMGYELKFKRGSTTDCYYYVYVCWKVDQGVDRLVEGYQAVVTQANFPQKWLAEGASKEALLGSGDCGVPVCDVDQWIQLDRYRIDGTSDQGVLDNLRSSKLLTWPNGGKPADDAIWTPEMVHWIIKIENSGECEPPPVDYCVFDKDTGTASHASLAASANPAAQGWDHYVLWENYSEQAPVPAGCELTNDEYCVPDGDGGYEYATLWEGDPAIETAVDAKYCGPVVTICEEGEGGWYGQDYYEEDLPEEYTEWTGDARDCFDVSDKVKICHATESGQNPFNNIEISFNAIFNGSQWEFDFANGHGTDSGTHDADIIPPFSVEKNGYTIAFDGRNWPEEFEGESGWEAWLDYWKNDCATPVTPSAGGTHTDLTCLNPDFGGFDYEAVIGSFQSPVVFTLVKLGEDGVTVVDTYGPFLPGAEVDISALDLGPGDYRITAMPAPVLAEPGLVQPMVIELNPYALFTYEFTIDEPDEDCFDIDSSYVEAICSDGTPLINWTVDLNDPAAQLPNEASDLTEITITFSKEGFTPWSTTVAIDPADYPLWSGQIEWPGFGTDGDGNPNAWPGWDTIDGVLKNVGTDNYGWTRDGATVTVQLNPETEITGVTYPAAAGDCEPPVIEVCEFTDGAAQMVTYYGEAPAGAIAWVNGLECTPIQICSEADGEWSPLTIMESMFNSETDQLWRDDMFAGGCEEPAEPTLTGSFIGGTCVADAPWLSYNIVVTNPDDQPLDGVEEGEEPMATITFVNPDGEDYTLPGTYPLGEGRILWPGAAVAPAAGYTEDQIDPTNGDTFVATDWPGWVQDEDGEWMPVDDPQDNFGWTRDGVQVLVQVNPETTVTVNYPPATPTCAANPPTTTTVVLDAPPLTPTKVADAPKPVAVRVASVTYTG
ncbi:hypothetical protein [Demequina sp. NBRC 110055]|uniref:hypothetical protein n=1 Tax=Demequina sp. NBRC 110055 TaxID=1570344 RepID=UPI000A02F571|nr:hypothetical protein [Demequina sp. NBRC 110055]